MTTTLNIPSLPAALQRIKLDVIKTSWIWLGLSVLLTIPGLVFMVMSMMTYPNHAPVKLGIDFTGGMMYRLAVEKTIEQDQLPKIVSALDAIDIKGAVAQLEQSQVPLVSSKKELMTLEKAEALQVSKTSAPSETPKATSMKDYFAQQAKAAANKQKATYQEVKLNSLLSLRTRPLTAEESKQLNITLAKQLGDYAVLEKNQIGPTLAGELFVQAAYGLVGVLVLILLYLSFRFQADYAVSAIVAMLHDALFILGVFSILGWYFNIEVNSMFVTAVLTVIGFSVHDTIVVFDRLRENSKRLFTQKLPFDTLVNLSVNQTFARSINTSLTALLTLGALYVFGGDSTKEFLLALILGIAVGTYSSIFVASTLLAHWRHYKQGNIAVAA